MRNRLITELWGELLGTFILVFVGLSAVGMAVILGWLGALYQVAIVWGLGAFLAIMISQRWSPAHLNPAVTLAMCIARHHSWRRLIPYSLAQLTGAILAGFGVLLFFEDAIIQFEKNLLGLDAMLYAFVGPLHEPETAQMFGEFFPNPAYGDSIDITWLGAMAAEAGATFLLLLSIFFIVKRINTLTAGPAALIALSVAILIWIFAPYTQCGMNPARDLGPRLVAYYFGWKSAALCNPEHAILTVYVLGPLLGATAAAYLSRILHRV